MNPESVVSDMWVASSDPTYRLGKSVKQVNRADKIIEDSLCWEKEGADLCICWSNEEMEKYISENNTRAQSKSDHRNSCLT